MLSKLLSDLPRILRFGTVGLLNTALGYVVILVALKLGHGDIMANASGFASGLVLSFVLNRNWTFDRAGGYRAGANYRYLLTFLVAYCVNLAVVLTARATGFVDSPLVHLAGIGAYSLTFYLGASRFVFVPQRQQLVQTASGSVGMLFARHWPEATLILCALTAYLALRDIAVSHDVIWQMWIARQLLGGAKLYHDILELNPPLWFWIAVPVEWAAQKFAVSPAQAIVTAVFLLVAGALVLLSKLLAEMSARDRAILLGAAFAAMVVVPLPDFGQREHLALVGAIPYVALIARRADNLQIDWKIAVATALVAATGFALKHYFALVPIALELWLLCKKRRDWTPMRAELLVLPLCAVVYAAAVLKFAPDFLATMVPMVRIAYAGYEISFLDQFARPYVAIWALSFFILWKQRRDASSLTVASAVAALAFGVAYFAQQKGWRYHSVPTSALALFATTTLWHRHLSMRTALPVCAGLVVCMLIPISSSLFHGPHRKPVWASTVANLLSDSRPGAPGVMLTANPSNIWPMVEEAGLEWPSRHFTFWMLHTIFAYHSEHGQLTPELQRLADEVRQQTADDLACNPPDLILVDDFRVSKSPGFDILGFFKENRDFERLFSHYTEERKLVIYTSYRKSADWQPERPPSCRTIY